MNLTHSEIQQITDLACQQARRMFTMAETMAQGDPDALILILEAMEEDIQDMVDEDLGHESFDDLF